MVEDQLDEIGSLRFVQFVPRDSLCLHLLLGTAVGTAIMHKVLESELDGGGEDISKLWLLGDLQKEGWVGC